MPKRKPKPFNDSFTTHEATIHIEVGDPWGEVTEAVKIKIDCNGEISGDEHTVDLVIEMLEKAKENLIARRGKLTKKRVKAL